MMDFEKMDEEKILLTNSIARIVEKEIKFYLENIRNHYYDNYADEEVEKNYLNKAYYQEKMKVLQKYPDAEVEVFGKIISSEEQLIKQLKNKVTEKYISKYRQPSREEIDSYARITMQEDMAEQPGVAFNFVNYVEQIKYKYIKEMEYVFRDCILQFSKEKREYFI